MKKLSNVFALIVAACCLTMVAACAGDPYRDYVSSGLRAKEIPFDMEYRFLSSLFSEENAKIFEDYEHYAAFELPLGYTEAFFEENNLLVFTTFASSSDEMRFLDILTHDGKLYPCYSRVRIRPGTGIAEDIIDLSYCAEFPKSVEYKLGEVIYKYR